MTVSRVRRRCREQAMDYNEDKKDGQIERSRTRDKEPKNQDTSPKKSNIKSKVLDDDLSDQDQQVQVQPKRRGRPSKSKPIQETTVNQQTNKKNSKLIQDEDEDQQMREQSQIEKSEKSESMIPRQSEKTLSDNEESQDDADEEEAPIDFDQTLNQEINSTFNENMDDDYQDTKVQAQPNTSSRGKRGRPPRKVIQEPKRISQQNQPGIVTKEMKPRRDDSKNQVQEEKGQQFEFQIDIDIEEETNLKQQEEKQQMELLRKKHPILFKIFDERQSLKFKNLVWVKQQAIKKQGQKAHLYKNLKQILTNFDNNPIQEGPITANLGPQYNYELGSFMSIDGGISVKVHHRYCDFTGFFSKYKHKVNGLRFTEDRHYGWIDKMQNSKVEEYLQQRKAFASIK
eukprot:403376382